MLALTRGVLRLTAALVLLLAWVAPGHAEGNMPIFVLHSYSQEYPWTKRQHEGFMRKLEAVVPGPIAASVEYLDTKRVPYSAAYADLVAGHLARKYAGFEPKLIYVTDDNALLFALAHLTQIFPKVPIFFSGVNDYGMRQRIDPRQVTGVFEKKEIAPNLELMRHLDPGVRDILVVGDASETYQSIRRDVAAELAREPDIRAQFVSSGRIEQLVASLQGRRERFVFLTTLGSMADARGRSLTLPETIAAIVKAGRFIIVSMEDVYLYPGVLGGYVTSGHKQGAAAAELGARYLAGTAVAAIHPVASSANEYVIDGGELEQLGLALPPEIAARATILNPRPAFFERNLKLIVPLLYAVALLFVLSLTASLVVVMRKNRLIARRSGDLEAQVALTNDVKQNLVRAQRIAGIGSWEWTPGGNAITWSEGLYAILGRDLTLPPPTFETLPRFYTPESWERLGAAIARTLEMGAPYELELEMIRADASAVWTLTRGEAVRGADGAVVKLRGTVHDIDARKAAEAKILRLSNLYAALSQCNQLVMHCATEQELFEQLCRAVVNVGGMKLAWIGLVDQASKRINPVASHGDVSGYVEGLEVSVDPLKPTGRGPAGTAIRENGPRWCQDFLHDPATAAWHERARNAGWRAAAAIPLHRLGIAVGALSIYSSEVGAFDEAVRKLLSEMAANISFALDSFTHEARRRVAEKTLLESEHRLSAVFRASPLGIVVSRVADGRIFDVNEAALRLYGYRREEVIGRTVAELGTYVNPAQREALVRQLREHGGADRFLIDFRRKSGELGVMEASCRTIELQGEQCLVAIMVDIGERIRAEQERVELEAQFQQAQKMDSVGRLAGGVAHDFNNMLTVILGNVALAMERVEPTQALYTDLSEIRNAANRSADLTRQLLAFARKQTVAPKVLDLNETVPGILKMLQRLIGEDIHLTWQPGVNLWSVMIDPSQIDQILANLCINARDAIAGVGHIVIETENSSIDEDFCADHAGFVPGEYVRLTVSDDGRGIEKEVLAHIFEPFFTTKEAGEGTGLGLATVYGAVKQNNGFINVYSEPDSGSRFTIYLPRHASTAEQEQTAGAAGTLERGKETVLLVEDEPSILKLATRVLARQGYAVLPANTPGEAIRLAGEHGGAIQLLMTDVVMPEMNGRDLAMKLLSLYPGLKVLFMSGYTASIILNQGVLDQGVHFIQKPFSVEDLAAKVREVLDGE